MAGGGLPGWIYFWRRIYENRDAWVMRSLFVISTVEQDTQGLRKFEHYKKSLDE